MMCNTVGIGPPFGLVADCACYNKRIYLNDVIQQMSWPISLDFDLLSELLTMLYKVDRH